MNGPVINVKRAAGYALVNPATGNFARTRGIFGEVFEVYARETDAHFVNRNAHGRRLVVVRVDLRGARVEEAARG